MSVRASVLPHAIAAVLMFASERAAAAACARPTDSAGYAGYKYAPDAARSFDSAHVRVWYTTSGSHAVGARSSREDGVPDDVAESAAVTENAWAQYQAMGYRALPSDAATGCSGYGGDSRLDVYLVNFGAADGLTATEGCKAHGTAQVCASFVLAESNFGDRYPTASIGIRTVLPHELFHSVQNAYNSELDRFWAEGTAQWSTKQLDPSLTDFESYLPSFFSQTSRALDAPSGGVTGAFLYGSAIWPSFLAAQHGPEFVREVLEREGLAGDDSLRATEAALLSVGSTMKDTFALFGAWNAATGEREDQGAGQGGYARAASYPMVSLIDPPEGQSFAGQTSGLATLYYRMHSDSLETLRVDADAERSTATLLPLREGRIVLGARKTLPTDYSGDAVLVISGATTQKSDARFVVHRTPVVETPPVAAPTASPAPAAAPAMSQGCSMNSSVAAGRSSPVTLCIIAAVLFAQRRAENAS